MCRAREPPNGVNTHKAPYAEQMRLQATRTRAASEGGSAGAWPKIDSWRGEGHVTHVKVCPPRQAPATHARRPDRCARLSRTVTCPPRAPRHVTTAPFLVRRRFPAPARTAARAARAAASEARNSVRWTTPGRAGSTAMPPPPAPTSCPRKRR